MVYGKRTGGKRRFAKRRLYRKRRGLGVKSVRKIAEAVVERGRESKLIQKEINAYPIACYQTGNQGYINSAAMFNLTPYQGTLLVPQGIQGIFQSSASDGRVGNKVEFVLGTVRMMLSCAGYNATSNPNPQPTLVKIYIGYDKTKSRGEPDPSLPQFYQQNNGAVPPTSTSLDTFRKVNTDRYVICYQRTVKLGFQETTQPTAPTVSNFANNDFKFAQNVNINFTKRMIKCGKFNDNLGTPTTRGLWCWIMPVPALGQTGVGAPVLMSAQIVCKYKDA